EIRNLRTLYAHHLDSNNIHLLDQVFCADAVVEVTVRKMEGIDAIRTGLEEAFDSTTVTIRGPTPSCT
ncbi:nuclear transport factor 2 family protein, partial [Pseudomonas viridiflava]|uniref:nuclear transport factor 2 family protein n=1 Tax=Pseudomonas viridiflava TaxID=33069 RepID=UPI001F140F55